MLALPLALLLSAGPDAHAQIAVTTSGSVSCNGTAQVSCSNSATGSLPSSSTVRIGVPADFGSAELNATLSGNIAIPQPYNGDFHGNGPAGFAFQAAVERASGYVAMPGIPGAAVTVTNSGSLTVDNIVAQGLNAGAISATSIGGFGAQGGQHNNADPSYYNGGTGGTVTVNNNGTVTLGTPSGTSGADPLAPAIGAYSTGGSGSAYDTKNDCCGGNGGNGGTVTVYTTSGSSIALGSNTVSASAGIEAVSLGGQAASQKIDLGEYPGNGGNGGPVTVNQAGSITGTSSRTYGIAASSVGASGTTIQGATTVPGSSGTVTVNLAPTGSIVLSGGNSVGVFAVSSPGDVTQAVGDQPVGGDVVVNLQAGSTVSVSGGGIAIGVLGVSTGTSSVLQIFDQQSVLNPAGAGFSGDVTISNAGSVSTMGQLAIGLAGISVGGAAVATTLDNGGSATLGNAGASVGVNTGAVTINNGGTIQTHGADAFGIMALAAGGGGLLHQDGTASQVIIGSNASTANYDNAEPGGTVTVNNGGTIITGGKGDNGTSGGAIGILAQSIGGGGGSYDGRALLVGDNAGGGGNAGTVSVTTYGAGQTVSTSLGTLTAPGSVITTYDDGAIGILAQSVGGGGGNGGNALGFAVAVGGAGGFGGQGNTVTVNLGGSITTLGDFADGVVAQSIGGGGGNGGYAKSVGVIDAAIGGTGGSGGSGGTIMLTNNSTVETIGGQSTGLLAQSIGGGGGTGGAGLSGSAGVFTVSIAVGGSGGSGGTGGGVTANNDYHITTVGHDSIGMLAQSIGGGGGNGGSATAASLTVAVPADIPSIGFSAALGGKAGSGQSGGSVTASNQGLITTFGNGSTGILAQSIGGGGGNGGDSTADAFAIEGASPTFSGSVSLGGSGGIAGNGGTVQVSSTSCSGCQSAISTSGNNAIGILAQSIGGGGGNGGAGSASVSSPNLGMDTGNSYGMTFSLGGSGGSSGSGGQVTITNGANAAITTLGSGSQGILAQSIGGGGGNGGGGSSTGSGYTVNVNVTLGGNAGAGSDGGPVSITNAGTIRTGASVALASSPSFVTGGDADGILAQSIGGGGGVGGSSDPAATISKTGQIQDVINTPSDSYSAQVGVGGSGGTGGNGGTVSVANTGSIVTLGARAYGIIAQSIGGGGGVGGAADASANSVVSGPAERTTQSGESSVVGHTYAASLTLGGSAGAAGDGNSVTVDNTDGTILTAGYASHGVLAQSIGGGGGVGGEGTVNNTTTIGLGIGVSGGSAAGGSGGAVTVNGTGSITTLGDDAYGVLAQSIGGGGGAASAGCTNSGSTTIQGVSSSACFGNTGDGVTTNTGPWNDSSDLGLTVGGNAGASGNGDAVSVTVDGPIVTTGARAMGIVAQSIGGGGGLTAAAAINISGTAVQSSPGSNAGKGGDVTVSLTASGSITTSGAGAWGILAQSIGGGGGFAGDPSLALLTPMSNTLAQTGTGNASAGTVSVTVNGNITTTGANAHGVFAQSIGGGGGLVGGCCNSATANVLAGNTAQFRGTTNATYYGDGGAIDITQGTGGTIRTSGLGSIGVVAQSSGNTAAPNNITINLSGAVIGGTNSGGGQGSAGAAGILVSGGGAAANPNSISVNSTGSVSTMDGTAGTAILANSGVTNVTNSGAITGSINLNEGPGAPNEAAGTITNNTGGVLNPGATLVASTLTNSGTINLPNFQVNLTDNFVQGSTGNLTFPFATPAQLAVSGSANLGGTITPIVGASFLPGTQTLLSASSLSVSATVAHPLLFTWDLQTPSNTVTLSPVSNFTPTRVTMSADATSVANYLTAAWNNADPKFGSVFATLYNNVSVGTTYVSLLDQLSPRATQVPVTALTNLSGMVLGSAMSCPQFEDGTTRLGEGSCVWAKGNGQVTDEYGLGGSVTSSGYHIGGQGAIGPNWHIGGAFGGGSIWASEGNGSKGSGQTYDGSVALKYTNGSWLFAGSLALANAAYSHNRMIDVPGVVDTALQSNSEALLFGGRLRAAYTFGFDGWYLRPMGDLDLFYTHTPAFTESGNSTYALAVNASSKVNVAITPTVEIGSRLDLNPATTLRAYADIGMSLLPDNNRSVAARFAGASLDDGMFSTTIKSPDVTGNLDLGIQLYHASGLDLRAEYDLRGGDAFLSQGGTLRLGYRF